MKNPVISQIYTQAFAKADNLLYLIDKDGFLIDCNTNLLDLLDCSSAEANSIGSIYELMHHPGLWTHEQIENFQHHDVQAIVSGRGEIEQQAIINNNGAILYFEIVRTPLSDDAGNALGLSVVFRDTTKQRQLAEQVRHLKSQLRYNHRLATPPVSSENRSQMNKLKILLIEDSVLVQKAEKQILMHCRCLADVVATPKQAGELFKPGKYDLVLMDLTLEEGNGYNLTAILRSREQGSSYRVPIIALTGHDPNDVGLKCDDAEMGGILRKPLTIEQANQLIQRYVRHADVQVNGLREFKH